MKTESFEFWQSKVSPILLNKYFNSDEETVSHIHMVKVDYRGSYRKLQTEVEIISLIDHQLQVLLPLHYLPHLASMDETRSIHLV